MGRPGSETADLPLAGLPRRASSSRFALLCAGLVLLTGFALGPVVGHDFVNYDDPHYVTENLSVLTGLRGPNAVWAFTTNHTANWIPFTWLSLMFDAELFGRDPAGYHATSLGLHVLSVLLLFSLLRRMTGATLPSALAAALFAVHPLHVEPVAWVSQRKDVLSTCFALLALHGYVLYAQRGRWAGYAASLLAFAASLLSKQMFVTLPFLLLLLDYWPLRRAAGDGPARRPLGGLLLEKLPFLVLAAVFSWVALQVQSGGGAVATLGKLGLMDRVANALTVYVLYLAKTVWPFGLAVFYPHPGAWQLTPVVNALLVLAGLTTGAFVVANRHPYVLFGWLWYLGALVPVIGLVQIGSQQMADRYTYVPHIGLFVAVAWLVQAWSRRAARLRWAPPAVAVLAVLALAVAARVQAGHWRDSESLFRHALAVTENNYLAHTNLGTVLHRKGQIYQAIEQYRRALEIAPFYHWAHYDIGLALVKQGRFEEASKHFDAVVRLKPDDARAHNNLGMTYRNRGELDRAIQHYQQAALLAPDYRLAQDNLAQALAERKDGG